MEIYFRDSRSLLVVFSDRKQRREITGRLSQILGRTGGDPGSAGLAKSPFVGRLSSKVASAFSAKMVSGFGSAELSVAQRKWQSREISNVSPVPASKTILPKRICSSRTSVSSTRSQAGPQATLRNTPSSVSASIPIISFIPTLTIRSLGYPGLHVH